MFAFFGAISGSEKARKLPFYSPKPFPHIPRPMLPIVINILLVIHVMISLFIVLLVLMQRPKNEGLGAAFGGGMTENLFGAQSTNVLQTITRWLAGLFFALTLLLSSLYVRMNHNQSAVHQKLTAPTVIPPAPPTPAPMPATEAPGAILTTPEAASPPVKPETPAPLGETPAAPAAPAAEKKPAPAPATPPEKPAAPESEKPAAPAPEKSPAPAPAPAEQPAPTADAKPAPAAPPAAEPKPAEPAN